MDTPTLAEYAKLKLDLMAYLIEALHVNEFLADDIAKDLMRIIYPKPIAVDMITKEGI
ncbi:MAG: hypothetical protein GY771_05285 [bacterium]|nr:hypothetical protein [bacterium]